MTKAAIEAPERDEVELRPERWVAEALVALWEANRSNGETYRECFERLGAPRYTSMLDRVGSGGGVAGALWGHPAGPASLSERERLALALMARGFTATPLAEIVGKPTSRITMVLGRAVRAVGATDLASAVRVADHGGLLDVDADVAQGPEACTAP